MRNKRKATIIGRVLKGTRCVASMVAFTTYREWFSTCFSVRMRRNCVVPSAPCTLIYSRLSVMGKCDHVQGSKKM